jgi:BlaI family penicillinase repressor
MTDAHRLGDLQLQIMRILWKRGRATVADVHEALRPMRSLALTTIATMLRKMEAKGVVSHTVDGRQFIYRPTVDEREVHRSMVGDLVERLFNGDASALVNHLISEGEIDPGELDELRARIEHARMRGRQEAHHDR